MGALDGEWTGPGLVWTGDILGLAGEGALEVDGLSAQLPTILINCDKALSSIVVL